MNHMWIWTRQEEKKPPLRLCALLNVVTQFRWAAKERSLYGENFHLYRGRAFEKGVCIFKGRSLTAHFSSGGGGGPRWGYLAWIIQDLAVGLLYALAAPLRWRTMMKHKENQLWNLENAKCAKRKSVFYEPWCSLISCETSHRQIWDSNVWSSLNKDGR